MKNFLNRMTAALLIFLLCGVPASAYAQTEPELQEGKISVPLLQEIDRLRLQSADGQSLPVWIWYKDIDQKRVTQEAEKQTGLTEKTLPVEYKMPDSALLSTLQNEQPGARQMQDYLRQTAVGRKLEQERCENYVMKRREISRTQYCEKSSQLLDDISLKQSNIIFRSEYAPAIIAKVDMSQIQELADSDEVEALYFYEEEKAEKCGIESVSESTGLNRAYSKTGLTGQGVKVGMIESGPPEPHDEINVIPVGNAPQDGHATNTARTIVGVQNGVAPNAALYATDSSYANIEQMLDMGVEIINLSFGWRVYQTPYSSIDKWFDHLSSQHRVLFICSAGNNLAENGAVPNYPILSPAMSYNSLAVGAYDNKETGANPADDNLEYYSRYNNKGGCAKPDILAPKNLLGGGTSTSAPIITGIAALLLELRPSLSFQPQVLKAILLASCQRKVFSSPAETMEQGITNKQGAGAVDAWNAVCIISRRQYGYGEISDAEETRNFVQPIYGAANMNVSIAWLQENSISAAGHESGSIAVGAQQNLDLRVYRGDSLVRESLNTDSSTEMAYFPLSSASNQYQIKVSKNDVSNTETVRFGYAWSTDKMAYEENRTGTDYPEGVFYIRHKDSGQYLTVNEATGEVVQSAFTGAKNQQWISSKKGTNPFTIKTNSDAVSGGLTKTAGGNQVVVDTGSGQSVYYAGNALNNTLGIKLASPVTPGIESLLTIENSQDGSAAIWNYVGVPERFQWYFEPLGYRRGDVSRDGVINTSDVLKMQNYISKIITFDESQLYLGDMNNDGQVSLADVRLLQNQLAGM